MSGGEAVAALMSPEVSIKLFVDDESVVRPLELIGVFQGWIKDGALDDEVAIDVANYEHVPKGPGIVIICDKAHFYFDVRDDRWGMRYRGRRAARATGEEAIARAFRSALHAASLLESDASLEGRYRFRTDEIEFGIYDRLLAPSEQGTLDSVQPALDATVRALYGAPAKSLELTSGPKEPFMVRIENAGSPSVGELLDNVAAAAG